MRLEVAKPMTGNRRGVGGWGGGEGCTGNYTVHLGVHENKTNT